MTTLKITTTNPAFMWGWGGHPVGAQQALTVMREKEDRARKLVAELNGLFWAWSNEAERLERCEHPNGDEYHVDYCWDDVVADLATDT